MPTGWCALSSIRLERVDLEHAVERLVDELAHLLDRDRRRHAEGTTAGLTLCSLKGVDGNFERAQAQRCVLGKHVAEEQAGRGLDARSDLRC